MSSLSAISSTCLWWANRTRRYMFRSIALCSSQRLRDLISILRTPSSPRILSIGECLREVVVAYKLTDYLWCHSIERVEAYCAYTPLSLVMFVSGPAPANPNTRRNVRHPLFHALPKMLPIIRTRHRPVRLELNDVAFVDVTGLVDLVHDLSLAGLFAKPLHCRNVTWGGDPSHSLPQLRLSRATDDMAIMRLSHLRTSHCTDHLTMAYVMFGYLVGDGVTMLPPFLDLSDYSLLFDGMRMLCHDLERGNIKTSCAFTYQPPKLRGSPHADHGWS